MDERSNPYSPGAGTIPQELAGRDQLVEDVAVELDRCRNGYAYRGKILIGLRGVGKTVLLSKLSGDAEAQGFWPILIETPENRSLPSVLVPALRNLLLASHLPSNLKGQALGLLRGFVQAMKMKFSDVEFSFDVEKQSGADSGDLETDLASLLTNMGTLAKKQKTAIALFVDEIQYIREEQFGFLITALHKCTQKQLPVILLGAGLPQVIGQAGKAKSYAERLFEYPGVGPLDRRAAIRAITVPASRAGVQFQKGALDEIFKKTQGYPYFIQEWGKHCWKVAQKSPVTLKDVKKATALALNQLDNSFFRVRFDRCTPLEKAYLRAMSELRPGDQKSGEIAHLLGKPSQRVAPVRAKLMAKGMIYSPAHGDNRFTVPLFGQFMKRAMPDWE